MKVPALSVLFLALALVATASPVIEETQHQRGLREHHHHLSYIADYSCHHPQARTVPVHELLSPYQTRGKAYFPEVTVLHRCDMFAGCCEGGKKCSPLHAHNVHLPFKVTYLEEIGGKHKGDWEMEYYHFDNHTVCHCDYHHGLYKHEEHDIHKDHHVPSHKDSGYKPIFEEHHDDIFNRSPEKRLDNSRKVDSQYLTI